VVVREIRGKQPNQNGKGNKELARIKEIIPALDEVEVVSKPSFGLKIKAGGHL
jgi:hypothetical protein